MSTGIGNDVPGWETYPHGGHVGPVDGMVLLGLTKWYALAAGTTLVLVALLSAAIAPEAWGLDGPQLAAVTAAIVTATAFVAALLRALVVSPHRHELEVTDALFSPVPRSESSDV